MSGLFVDGSKSTTISQYDLWPKRINDAGGLMLSKYNKKAPVEIVYYDGRFDINETTKLTEKLILDDKVDMMLAPWGTAWNIASAPITNKYEYPVIYTTAGDSVLTPRPMIGPMHSGRFRSRTNWSASDPLACADEEGREDQGACRGYQYRHRAGRRNGQRLR